MARAPRRLIARPCGAGRLLRALCAACVLACAPAWTTARAGPPDTLVQRLSACTPCHGARGEGTLQDAYYPRIAGKPAGYLFRQLRNFRDGRRSAAQMTYLVRYLSDDYLREIARYFAQLPAPHPEPGAARANAMLLAAGKALVRAGDPARGIPACAACHGSELAGREPGIPGLTGLYPDYINNQLNAWQQGRRHADAPDCMGSIAAKLTAEDIAAVSAWLGQQRSPEGARPEPAAGRALPAACGSQQAVAAPPAPAALSEAARRGQYLSRIGDCAACHTARGGAPFAGGVRLTTPFGAIFTSNLTPDPGTGLGRWDAEAFWQALHEGRSRDGSWLYPVFPYPNYTRMSRQDADDLFAFLQSLRPVLQETAVPQMRFPYGERALLRGWRALYFRPGAYRPQTQRTAQWNRGAYLVQGPGHCDACHGSRNSLGAIDEARRFSGGLMPVGEWFAPALGASAQTGIGQWSEQDLIALLRTGVSARGMVFGPMAGVVQAGLQYLSDEDAQAVAVYLKSLGEQPEPSMPPQVHLTASQSEASYEAGGKLYGRYCQGCHGAGGEGALPAYPPLANNQAISMAYAVNPIRMVLFGGFPPSTAGNPRPYGMPPFAYRLDDEQVAAVLSYVRMSWGNRGEALSAADVRRLRSLPED